MISLKNKFSFQVQKYQQLLKRVVKLPWVPCIKLPVKLSCESTYFSNILLSKNTIYSNLA